MVIETSSCIGSPVKQFQMSSLLQEMPICRDAKKVSGVCKMFWELEKDTNKQHWNYALMLKMIVL